MDLLYYMRPVHQGMLNYLCEGGGRYLAPSLKAHLDATPKWRFIRRVHIERQLALAVALDEAVKIGYSRCVKGL